jgi:hypothetical protein
MHRITIFVSCGQKTEKEISLGLRVKEAIDAEPGFKAYFAENVQNLNSLNHNVFDAISQCSGVVVFFHDRGTFTDNQGESTRSSSIWINQEMAILSYRQFFESRNIPILPFKEGAVSLGGAMTSMILHPLPITSEADVVAEVKRWLKKENFGSGGTAIFDEKWRAVTKEQHRFLACLIDEGGEGVKEAALRKRLIKDFGLEKNDASRVILNAKQRLTEIGFVEFASNIDTGDEFSLHDSWAFLVRREIMAWQSKI